MTLLTNSQAPTYAFDSNEEVDNLLSLHFRIGNAIYAPGIANLKKEKTDRTRDDHVYMISHDFPPLSLADLTPSATLAASVKASLTPLFRIAEHSRYLNAPILLATLSP